MSPTISINGAYIFMGTVARMRLPRFFSKDYFKWCYGNLLKCKNILLTFGVLQAASVSGVLWMQHRQWHNVNRKLLERMREHEEATRVLPKPKLF